MLLKAVAPVLFALAALATPNDVTPPTNAVLKEMTQCHQVSATGPTGPEQTVTVCPNPT